MCEFEQLGHSDSRILCIRTHFDFLERQHSFVVTQESDQIVRWERGKVYICCGHGVPEDGLRMTFGPLRAPGQSENTFDEDDLNELFQDGRQLGWQTEAIVSLPEFEDRVRAAADVFQKDVLPRIRSDRDLFDRLAQARRERGQEFARTRSHRLARELVTRVRVRTNKDCSSEAIGMGRPLMDPAGLDSLRHAVRSTRPILENFFPDRAPMQHKRTLAMLRPKPDDYVQLFKPGAAATAAAKYSTIWQATQRPPVPRPEQTDLVIDACFSEWLSDENELSLRFPPGYQWIAPQLRPGSIWMCWRYLAPESPRGSAFNGLVYLGHRWTWLPNPHRVLTGS